MNSIRIAFGALAASLALAAALVVSTGTASADIITTTPVPVPVPCVPAVGITCDHHHDGGFGPHGFGGGFNGHFINLGGGVSPIDVCPFGSYQVLSDHFPSYRGEFGQLFGGDPYTRFNQLRTQCAAPPVVSANGQCVTVRDTTARDGEFLNDSRQQFNNDLLRFRALHGGNDGLLSGLELGQLRQAHALELNRLGDWNQSFGRFRTVCQQQQPPVVIIQEVPAPAAVTCGCTTPATVTQTPEATAAPETTPAPVAAPPPTTFYHYPTAAPDTGGGPLGW